MESDIGLNNSEETVRNSRKISVSCKTPFKYQAATTRVVWGVVRKMKIYAVKMV